MECGGNGKTQIKSIAVRCKVWNFNRMLCPACKFTHRLLFDNKCCLQWNCFTINHSMVNRWRRRADYTHWRSLNGIQYECEKYTIFQMFVHFLVWAFELSTKCISFACFQVLFPKHRLKFRRKNMFIFTCSSVAFL